MGEGVRIWVRGSGFGLGFGLRVGGGEVWIPLNTGPLHKIGGGAVEREGMPNPNPQPTPQTEPNSNPSPKPIPNLRVGGGDVVAEAHHAVGRVVGTVKPKRAVHRPIVHNLLVRVRGKG